MDITRLVARRSTCLRRQVGAIMVKEKNILATGYNGTPSGIMHCDMTGCLREQLNVPSGERHELCRGLHAEQNAIIQAARHGVNISSSTLYCTNSPCIICTKMLINADIRKVVTLAGYSDTVPRTIRRRTSESCFRHVSPYVESCGIHCRRRHSRLCRRRGIRRFGEYLLFVYARCRHAGVANSRTGNCNNARRNDDNFCHGGQDASGSRR